MNRKTAAITLLALLSSASFHAFAAETASQGSAVPPAAIPGLNQAHGTESNQDKASKKGEEAAGSNSGADSQTLEKEAASSNNPKDDGKTQQKNDSEG
ncbi:hypothetical protein PS918_02510 [Pseudomonas fluorescens]|uniref:Secreted protein n=1 Tax=Pseudomonas fluorescens TaxID=294 RepID=A0A5E7SB42_PSEFL|nr:hypothetical protein [Pseudomonas fluorescens]VVP83138.1 hypothetical protein PS918_02510 [Pseudomonas fluorescens]